MTKNNAKISVSVLDKLLKELDLEPVAVTLRTVAQSIGVEVRRAVSLQEFCDMVEEAVGQYFQFGEDGQEYYVAGLGDFACDYVLLGHLTNLKTAADVDNKEQQIERLYALCVHTDLVRLVEEALPQKLVLDFHEAVYEQVEFRKQQLLSDERRTLQAAVDQIDKANTTFAKFVKMFQDVDPASMMESMQKIVSMDAGKLASAVAEAQYDAAGKQTLDALK